MAADLLGGDHDLVEEVVLADGGRELVGAVRHRQAVEPDGEHRHRLLRDVGVPGRVVLTVAVDEGDDVLADQALDLVEGHARVARILLDDQLDGVAVDPVMGVLPVHPRLQGVRRQLGALQLGAEALVADLEWRAGRLLRRFVVPGARWPRGGAGRSPYWQRSKPRWEPLEPLPALLAAPVGAVVAAPFVAGLLVEDFDEPHAPAINVRALATLASSASVLRPLRSLIWVSPLSPPRETRWVLRGRARPPGGSNQRRGRPPGNPRPTCPFVPSWTAVAGMTAADYKLVATNEEQTPGRSRVLVVSSRSVVEW